jgi:hypothetical protein
MSKIGDLKLPEQMFWENMMSASNVWQQIIKPISGKPIIIEGNHNGGQLIKLHAGLEYDSWFEYHELVELLRMANQIGVAYNFTWNDIITNPIKVMFLRSEDNVGVIYEELTKLSQTKQNLQNTKIRAIFKVEINLISLEPLILTQYI